MIEKIKAKKQELRDYIEAQFKDLIFIADVMMENIHWYLG